MSIDRLAVAIVSYRCRDLTLRCLGSLRRVGWSGHCILVDNSPEPEFDPSEPALAGLDLIAPGANLGFAGGCNLGIARALQAGADYVLLLNPDTMALEDFWSPVLRVLDANPGIGAAAPLILDADGSLRVQFAGGDIVWWKGGPRHRLQDRSGGREWEPVAFVTGCAMFLRSAAIRKVGGLDERYFLYFEDADYVERLKRAGWTIAYVPGARLLHERSGVTYFQSQRYVYYFSRNRLLYLARWAPRRAFAVYLLVHLLVKVPGACVVFGLMRRRWALVGAFLRGIKDALLGRTGRMPGQ